MYKVFVDDKPIIITSSLKNETNFPVYQLNNCVVEEIIYKLKNENIPGIILYTEELAKDWVLFLKKVKVISAAGGLVLNQNNKILLIFRNGVWDLPKGRIEKGEIKEEATIREVTEECGISHLILKKPLITTYHFYDHKGIRLKETFWFLMTSSYKGTLTPQTEEGITEVAFKDEGEIAEAFKNTYGNIKLVYNTYIAQR